MADEKFVNGDPEVSQFYKNFGYILETIRKPFLLMDMNYKILFANQRFCDTFQISSEQLAGHGLYSAANGEWDIAGLRSLLDVVLTEKEISEDDFEIDHAFPRLGRKILRINAQCTFLPPIERQVVLLSIEDYTKRKYAEQRLWESEQRFRRMSETSSDGLLLINKETGVITDANPALFNYWGKQKTRLSENKSMKPASSAVKATSKGCWRPSGSKVAIATNLYVIQMPPAQLVQLLPPFGIPISIPSLSNMILLTKHLKSRPPR